MLNLLEEQLLDDVVSRAEQSRFSYTLQTEEFRNLNSNLQTYLNDIKTIDDENRQIQENIEQIRTTYIGTLENHLKRLPEDFRQESSILTEAHVERYRSKSRAKRFLSEREELKKRIHFLVNNEKNEMKRLHNLQKQERLIENEFKTLNEQMHNLYNYLQTEKQTHQQVMNKVDELQIQLEQICIERSKKEFQIQTLREEVKLMETAKEFLDEEHQTILSTQMEANEYFLSRLNDSISRIREDFNDLNKNQLKHIENEYKQMINILEENSFDETIDNQQRTSQIEYDKLQDEYQMTTKELTTLNDHNHILSERILHMESDLYAIRDERMRELLIKDNEFEKNQIELQTLNEKLNHLAEYDRNLKFELTLYRGVLESEYRRKQQQQQQQFINNQQQPIRPTSLETTMTITIRNKKHPSILINRNQLEPIVEKNTTQIDEENKEQNDNVTEQEQYQIPTETSPTPVSTVPQDQLSFSEVQQSPNISPTNQEASLTSAELETSNVSTLPVNSTLTEDPLTSSPTNVSVPPVSSVSLSADSELQSEPQNSLTTTTISEDQQESSEIKEAPITQSKDEQIPLEAETSSVSPSGATSTTDLSFSALPDVQQSSNTLSNEEPSSTLSQEDQSIPSDAQQKVLTSSQDQSPSVEVQQSSVTDEHVEEQAVSVTESPTRDVNNDSQLTEVSDEDNNLLTKYEEKTEKDELVDDNQSIEPQERETSPNEDIRSTEEQISSSDQNQNEKDDNIGYISSPGYYGPINNSSHLTNAELIGEVESITSPKLETFNESNLATIMQDIRYVYNILANNDDLVEINDDFPENLIDRLEFGDNLIRTLFDSFLRKYLVQTAQIEMRPKTLDWIEFRDILFPIVTGRYMEDHIRKLFDLFDINKTGYLSFQEIIELLEILQVNNSNIFIPNKDLNIDEIIEIIKKTDNIVPDDISTKQWYTQPPTDEENVDSLEVPVINTINRMILLSRIFKRVGTDFENKQIDSRKSMLSMKLTNEFIHNNVQISNDDLQLFIELYLNKKRNSDYFINWTEFRNIFFPIVNDGMVSKDDIERWFDILDENHNQMITQEQVLHFLRLIQLENPEEILNKIQEIYPNNTNCWTLGELIFCLENVDETTIHILPKNDQLSSFDLEWFTKNTC